MAKGREVRTTYTAAVEVATRTPLDVERVSELSDYRPKVGTSPRGWLEVRLSLTATSLAHACATALAVASAATGAEAIACEVMTSQESDDREGFLPGQRTATAVRT
jgi:hypothetical protein